MRSESDGHCYPTSFPGLAAREAARRLDLLPLMLSVCNRYRPTVAEFLRHVDELRVRSGWDESFRPARIEWVRAVADGFELDSHGTFRHVLLAPGHPGLALPPSSPATAGSSTPTSRTSTPLAWRSSGRAWRLRPSG